MEEIWRGFFVLIVAMFLYGCGTATPRVESLSLPRVEHKVVHKKAMIDRALIEGENEVIFAVTPEERAKYIPKTLWREIEKTADEEECSFTFVAASERLETEKIEQFLSSHAGSLRLEKDEWVLLELSNPYWLSEIGVAANGKLDAMVTDRSMGKPYQRLIFSMSQAMVFDKPLLCKYLLVKALDETGADLRHLHAKGKPVFASQVTRVMKDNPVVLEAKDPRNPLSIWRYPLSDDYYK